MNRQKHEPRAKQPKQRNGHVETSRLPLMICTMCRRTVPIPRGSTATETLTARYKERHQTGRKDHGR